MTGACNGDRYSSSQSEGMLSSLHVPSPVPPIPENDELQGNTLDTECAALLMLGAGGDKNWGHRSNGGSESAEVRLWLFKGWGADHLSDRASRVRSIVMTLGAIQLQRSRLVRTQLWTIGKGLV